MFCFIFSFFFSAGVGVKLCSLKTKINQKMSIIIKRDMQRKTVIIKNTVYNIIWTKILTALNDEYVSFSSNAPTIYIILSITSLLLLVLLLLFLFFSVLSVSHLLLLLLLVLSIIESLLWGVQEIKLFFCSFQAKKCLGFSTFFFRLCPRDFRINKYIYALNKKVYRAGARGTPRNDNL